MFAAGGFAAWVETRLKVPQWPSQCNDSKEAVDWEVLILTRVDALVDATIDAPFNAEVNEVAIKVVNAVCTGVNNPEA